MRPRTIIALLSMILFACIGGATAYGLSEHPSTTPPAQPTVSAACQTAADHQDAYAQYADNNGYLTTYTNTQQLAANQIDGALVTQMINAGCPQNVRYYDMTTGTWVN